MKTLSQKITESLETPDIKPLEVGQKYSHHLDGIFTVLSKNDDGTVTVSDMDGQERTITIDDQADYNIVESNDEEEESEEINEEDIDNAFDSAFEEFCNELEEEEVKKAKDLQESYKKKFTGHAKKTGSSALKGAKNFISSMWDD